MIPHEVCYSSSGKSNKKTRTVVCVICPTVLAQIIGGRRHKAIYIDTGNINCNWEHTSYGYEMYFNNFGWLRTCQAKASEND